MRRLLPFVFVLLALPAFAQTPPPGAVQNNTTAGGGGSSIPTPVSIANGGTGSATGAGLVDRCTSATGTDAYACSTATTCPASLAASRPVIFTADVANVGNATMNYCALGAKNIVKQNSVTLADNDIRAKDSVLIVYNATDDNWKMLSAVSNGSTTGTSLYLSGNLTVDGLINGCLDAGASDTYACNISPALTVYTTGTVYWFKANTLNTGAATVNFNSLGAKAIKITSGGITTDPLDNCIRAGQYVEVVYDGTNMQMMSACGTGLISTRTVTLTGPTVDGRSYAIRDANDTIATVGAANTWSAGQTYNSNLIMSGGEGTIFFTGPANTGGLGYGTTNTPDIPSMYTGTLSNSWRFAPISLNTTDLNNGPCGTTACTDPVFIIFGNAAGTTQYNASAVWGQAGGSIKTLTESAATAVVRIPVAALSGTGGRLLYRVFAADATDIQVREGEIRFAVVNKAGTETCTLSAASEVADGSVAAISAGTLTYAIAADTATPTNGCDITFNAVSSLTQTTLNIQYFVTLTGTGQPARQ